MFYEEKIREALKTDKFQVLNWQNDPTAKGAFREELLYKKTLEILALQTECDVPVPGIRVKSPPPAVFHDKYQSYKYEKLQQGIC